MNAPEAIQEYEETQKDKSRLRHLASSPLSPSLLTRVEILNFLIAASTSNLAEAQAAFPTPEPSCLSPNSMGSVELNLAPTTIICDASLEENSPSVAQGTTA